MSTVLDDGELVHLLAAAGTGLLPAEALTALAEHRTGSLLEGAERQTYVLGQGWTPPALANDRLSGRLAACDALSLVFAQGARPLLGLPLLGPEVAPVVMEGLVELCAGMGMDLGRPLAVPEGGALCGLALLGQAMPRHVKNHSQARPGDLLILGRPLGSGVYRTAVRRGQLHPGDLAAWRAEARLPDTPGPLLACLDGVHAMLALRGDGLLGHLQALCQASGVAAELKFSDVPLLPRAIELSAAHLVADAQVVKRVSAVEFGPRIEPAVQAILGGPQVGGGLLVSCAPDTVTEVLSIFLQQEFEHVSVIGRLSTGPARIRVD